MNRWSALAALLLICAAALAFRIPGLSVRPFHNDEAVNATKVVELWEQGRYRYDPDEYHGPTLHYATLPFLWLSGARNSLELRDSTLRLAPVFFGAGLILLLLLVRDGLGNPATVWAALFTAISPAMVFYSRYFIHEIPLIFFTALALAALWRYGRRPGIGWASLMGASVGLMFATKETFVLPSAAAVGAGVLTIFGLRKGWIKRDATPEPPEGGTTCFLMHAGVAIAAAVVVWLVFFTSFFTNPNGLADSIRTYLPWLKRAGGHSPHIHPWYFYLQRLAWFHPVKGPAWSEALILALAAIGIVVSLLRRTSLFHVFLSLYTLALMAAYTIISYKTPWCLLGFFHGMILLAGIGAAASIEFFKSRTIQIVIGSVIAILSAQLAWQAYRASYVFAADRRNPYVYAQTVPDLLNLVQKIEGIARIAPNGFDTTVKVITADGDYWPLPWYLRRFRNIGWFDSVPQDPFAPIMIVSQKLEAAYDEESEKKWIMIGYTELRPRVFLETYVELELWKKYVATLPKPKDDE